jgi:predicted MFS family arabinose efflux permease
MEKKSIFTKYEGFMIAILAIIQFTVILDFMVLSPLGVILMEEMEITTSQFGLVVSAYAFSAGIASLLAAGFADKFDRKKMLLFFYAGFLAGTVLCAMATSYEFLLIARIITGIFGGVIGSIGFAIITDLFKLQVRGRVMGYVQMAFGVSQIMGIPVGMTLADNFGWHSCFWVIAVFGAVIGVIIMIYMKPVDTHLEIRTERNPLQHLVKTISHPEYLRAFLGTVLLATGGFMLMPFGSAFSNHNLGIAIKDIRWLYFVPGIFSIILGPVIGRLSDKAGKYRIFLIGTIVSIIIVAIYTRLGVTPLWICILLNVIMFLGINARMISSSTLISAIPDPQDRGAFMSVNSSIQQISGGIASAVAGLIVVQSSSGYLLRYDTLGLVVIGSMIVAAYLMYLLDRFVKRKLAKAATMKSEAPQDDLSTHLVSGKK